MLEIAPGVYTSPRMTAGVRERVWAVIEDWFGVLGGGSVVMTWRDQSEPCGQGVRALGKPPRRFAEIDGLVTTVAITNKAEVDADLRDHSSTS
jgi:CRISPR-associated protein Cas2